MKKWWRDRDWLEKTLTVIGIIPLTFCALFIVFVGLPLYILEVITGR
jgi:uncharacterized membrane protein YdfJ with MMPL/SSD domain